MMTFVTDAPMACGIVELDEQGLVQEFHEKVASPPVISPTGLYMFSNQKYLSSFVILGVRFETLVKMFCHNF